MMTQVEREILESSEPIDPDPGGEPWLGHGPSGVWPIDGSDVASVAKTRQPWISVVMPEFSTISGTVVDDQGKPVAGATIVADPETRAGPAEMFASGVRCRGVSGLDGRFALSGANPETSYWVRAQKRGADGRELSAVVCDVAGTVSDVEIHLSRRTKRTVRLRVTSAKGSPIPRFEVRVWDAMKDKSIRRIGSSPPIVGRAGEAVLQALPEGARLVVEVRARGFLSSFLQLGTSNRGETKTAVLTARK